MKAVELIDEKRRARVISHYDADGISAAGIICKALTRRGIEFHASLRRSYDQRFHDALKVENNAFLIIADMGSGQIDEIEELSSDVIILDHHTVIRESDSIVQINPHLFGFNGSTEGSASTISFLLSLALDESNWDMCGYALAGALSDRQHVPEFSGLNKIILDEAMKAKLVRVERELALNGSTLEESLEKTIFPFFKGISGRKKEIAKLAKRLGLDPNTEIRKMEIDARRALISYLAILLLRQGVRPETIEELVLDRYMIESLKTYASELGSLMNACGRTGNFGTGLAMCLGDKEARARAEKLRERYISGMMEGLIKVEKEGVFDKDNIQFFYATDPSYAGTWAGVGMQYLFNQEKPTIALSVQNTQTRASGRGTRYLVSKGLDLAEAFKVAAESLGGSGGGHAVASGASFPRGKEEKFLEIMDSIVGEQLKSHE